MGLCKCPKRQVTNQFCFEHRVNVCEHCMVTSHPKCVVQSYLQWLKDSDYDSSCSLCRTALEAGDCVRLICYHVFHWDCLNAREAALPANTAPSGRTCPVCSDHVFPPGNLISPVADVLRSRLGQVNWGRSELGLPLLAGEEQPVVRQHQQLHLANSNGSNSGSHHQPHQQKQSSAMHSAFAEESGSNTSTTTVAHSVLNMNEVGSSQFDGPMSSRRPLLAARASPIGASDADDNKYKKRSPAEMFRRWSRRFYAPSSRPPWRRTWCLVLSGVLVFVFFVYMMAVLGRGTSNAGLDDGGDDAVQSHM